MNDPTTLRPLSKNLKYLLMLASLLAFLAGVQLFVLTEFTDRYFAWTIKSHITATFLGACWLTASVLFFMCSQKKRWSDARIALPVAMIFLPLMLVVTLLHLDKFHFSSPFPSAIIANWAWLAVYVLTPIAFVALFIQQLKIPGTDKPRQAFFPWWWSMILGIQAVVMLVLGIILVFDPTKAALFWPWPLTPLTGRATGAWLFGIGIIAMHVIIENDRERISSGAVTYTVLGILQLIALIRYPGEANQGGISIWVYLFFVLSVAGIGLYSWRSLHRANQQVMTK